MILVFKTTVDSFVKAGELKSHLDQSLSPARWNFDLQDCDRILRVDSEENIAGVVIETLSKHGFECEELF